MPDLALTAGREQICAFHGEPVLSSGNQVYARHGSGIRSLLDLNGARVVVLTGSSQQEFFLKMAEGFSMRINLVPQPDFAAAFAADAVVASPFYGTLHGGLEDVAISFFDPPGPFLRGAPVRRSGPARSDRNRHGRTRAGACTARPGSQARGSA